jgi:uncharacterized Zn finger protein (UPF0148 family)
MKCPNCNQKLIENKYGDLVCPNCGIQVYHEEEKKEAKYIG